MLLHQLPTRQDALRVRVWRRLQAIGAVNVRNACWCLPDTEQAHEDFQWCVKEIAAAGGEAMICRSALVEGMTNEQIRKLFQADRNADYAAVVAEARLVAAAVSADDRESLDRQAAKLRRSVAAIVAIDHGAAGGRAAAEQAVARLERRVAERRTTTAEALGDLHPWRRAVGRHGSPELTSASTGWPAPGSSSAMSIARPDFATSPLL